jgi:hypothetical protein
LAVAGFVLAFILAPVGLVLSLVAIGRTGPGKAPGRGLAVSGAVISGFLVLVGLAVLGAAGAAQEAPDREPAAGAPPADEAAPIDEAPIGSAPSEAAAPVEPAPVADAAPEAEEPEQPVVPGIGVPVTDGEFTFTVDSVERIGRTVGSEWVNETAQGEFVLVRVTVTNTGDEPRQLAADAQALYDVEGRRFAGGSGLFLLEDAGQSFFRTVNPGNTVTGAPVLYDVPVGVELDRIELHDTYWSPGVTVSLR